MFDQESHGVGENVGKTFTVVFSRKQWRGRENSFRSGYFEYFQWALQFKGCFLLSRACSRYTMAWKVRLDK